MGRAENFSELMPILKLVETNKNYLENKLNGIFLAK